MQEYQQEADVIRTSMKHADELAANFGSDPNCGYWIGGEWDGGNQQATDPQRSCM